MFKITFFRLLFFNRRDSSRVHSVFKQILVVRVYCFGRRTCSSDADHQPRENVHCCPSTQEYGGKCRKVAFDIMILIAALLVSLGPVTLLKVARLVF